MAGDGIRRGSGRRVRPRRTHRIHRPLGSWAAGPTWKRLSRRRPGRNPVGQPRDRYRPGRQGGADRRRRSGRLRRARTGHRFVRVRSSGAWTRPAVLPRVSHPRRSRRDPRQRAAHRGRRRAGRGGHRRGSAGPGGRQRIAIVRAARARRRDGAAVDGPTARRGRRGAAGPDDRRTGNHRAHRRRHREYCAGTTKSARPADCRRRFDAGDAERRHVHRHRRGGLRGRCAPT